MNQALHQAATATFEEMGFMFPVERALDSELHAEDCLNVMISFVGPLSGKFVLRVERAVLPLAAANMLGEEAPFADELLDDVAGEIANVICGNALPNIGGKDVVFDLSAPQISSQMDSSRKISAETKLEMEEGRADVVLYLN